MVVSAEIHAERSGDASRPEPEIARPEVEINPVENPPFSSFAAIGSCSQLDVEESETVASNLCRVIHFRPDRNRK